MQIDQEKNKYQFHVDNDKWTNHFLIVLEVVKILVDIRTFFSID